MVKVILRTRNKIQIKIKHKQEAKITKVIKDKTKRGKKDARTYKTEGEKDKDKNT